MKKVVVTLLIITVFACVVLACIFATNKARKNKEDKEMSYEELERTLCILRADTIDDLIIKARDSQIKVKQSQEYYSINDVSCNDFILNAGFLVNGTSIRSLFGTFSCETVQRNEEEDMEEYFEEFCSICSALFGVDINRMDYNIYDEQRRHLNANNPESYESILEGEAKMTLHIREEDGTYWMIESEMEGSVLQFNFIKRFDAETYANTPADITLGQ